MRVGCELLFLLVIANVEPLASWVERWINHRTLVVDPSRIGLVQKVAIAMISVGILIEICNAVKLLLHKHRRK